MKGNPLSSPFFASCEGAVKAFNAVRDIYVTARSTPSRLLAGKSLLNDGTLGWAGLSAGRGAVGGALGER